MNQELVAEYLAAFEAANPGHGKPQITFDNGWYRLSTTSKPVREAKLVEMRDLLKQRAVSAQALNLQQGI